MDIEDIYNLIPDFMCTDGCHECCQNFGVPSRTKVEDERIKGISSEKLHETWKSSWKYLPVLK